LKEHINLEFVKMIKVLILNQFLVFFGMVDRNFCCIIVREAVKLGVFFFVLLSLLLSLREAEPKMKEEWQPWSSAGQFHLLGNKIAKCRHVPQKSSHNNNNSNNNGHKKASSAPLNANKRHFHRNNNNKNNVPVCFV